MKMMKRMKTQSCQCQQGPVLLLQRKGIKRMEKFQETNLTRFELNLKLATTQGIKYCAIVSQIHFVIEDLV